MSDLEWYWSERTHQEWQRLRARGAAHFILVRGVLGWGGSMFVLFALLAVVAAFIGSPFFRANLSLPAVIPDVGIVCLAGGLTWGVLTWCISELMYRKHSAGAP